MTTIQSRDGSPNSSAQIVEWLCEGSPFQDENELPRVKETHISWVVLTERYALKLKKPVRFGFLDFSTVEKRRRACQDEVRLNRRITTDVYLSTVPICLSSSGSYSLDGPGEPVDWLVKMRRLKDEDSLLNQIRSRKLSESTLNGLAKTLASFLMAQAPQTMEPSEFRHRLTEHIEANLIADAQIHQSNHALYSAAAQRRYVSLMERQFDDRVCDGRIIEGHGDLRPDHIYLTPTPQVIDCIEFNKAYRQNDPLDEIAFLAMECDRLGMPQIAANVLQEYQRQSNDRFAPSLFSFYKCYRACVRAKISQLQSESPQGINRETELYLAQAANYADSFSPRLMVTVGGMIGTGKSTLAQSIAQKLKAIYLSTDAIRDDVVGPSVPGLRAQYDAERYSTESRRKVYKELFTRAAMQFNVSPTIVLDGTFADSQLRSRVADIANQTGAHWLHVECECPEKISIQRIANRSIHNETNSEADIDTRRQHVLSYQPPADAEFGHSERVGLRCSLLRVNTVEPLPGQTSRVMSAVREVTLDQKASDSRFEAKPHRSLT